MPVDEFKNFRGELVNNTWVVAPVSTNSSGPVHEAAPTIDEEEDLIAFNRYTGVKGTIYFNSKDALGNWQIPQALPSPVNGLNCSNDNPYIVGNLRTKVDLYFESDRVDLLCTSGGRNKRLFKTTYHPQTDSYSPVVLLEGIQGSDPLKDEDTQPFVTQDQKPLISANFSLPATYKLILLGEPNILETPEGFILHMVCGVAESEVGKVKGAKIRLCRARKNKP